MGGDFSAQEKMKLNAELSILSVTVLLWMLEPIHKVIRIMGLFVSLAV
jgi:hypothetical protein